MCVFECTCVCVCVFECTCVCVCVCLIKCLKDSSFIQVPSKQYLSLTHSISEWSPIGPYGAWSNAVYNLFTIHLSSLSSYISSSHCPWWEFLLLSLTTDLGSDHLAPTVILTGRGMQLMSDPESVPRGNFFCVVPLSVSRWWLYSHVVMAL